MPSTYIISIIFHRDDNREADILYQNEKPYKVCKRGLFFDLKYENTGLFFKYELYIALHREKYPLSDSQSTYAMNPYGKGGKARLSFSR